MNVEKCSDNSEIALTLALAGDLDGARRFYAPTADKIDRFVCNAKNYPGLLPLDAVRKRNARTSRRRRRRPPKEMRLRRAVMSRDRARGNLKPPAVRRRFLPRAYAPARFIYILLYYIYYYIIYIYIYLYISRARARLQTGYAQRKTMTALLDLRDLLRAYERAVSPN